MRTTRENAARELSAVADVHRPRPVAAPACPRNRGSQIDLSCSICGRPALQDLVDAAGDLGVVHRPCFVQWDTKQEAVEHMIARSLGFPHQGEGSADLELELVGRQLSAADVASSCTLRNGRQEAIASAAA